MGKDDIKLSKIIKNMAKETSKLVLFAILIFCFVCSTVIMIGWFLKLTDAVEMFKTIIYLLIIVTSFYTWKARSENLEKLKKSGILSEETINNLCKDNNVQGNNPLTTNSSTESDVEDDVVLG